MTLPERGIEAREGLEFDKFREEVGGDIVVAVSNTDGTPVGSGTSATSLGKAVDSVAGATDTGVAALVVRDDALSNITPADGDYTVLRVDNQGVLWARLSGPVNLNATKTDDSAFGIATDSVMPSGFIADDTATDSVNEGDVGIGRMSLDRVIYVRQNPGTAIHAGTTTTVGDSATSVTLKAENTARSGLAIRNNSTAILYIEQGSPATTASVDFLQQGEVYELPILAGGEVYRGIITGIWASAAGGSAYVRENV